MIKSTTLEEYIEDDGITLRVTLYPTGTMFVSITALDRTVEFPAANLDVIDKLRNLASAMLAELEKEKQIEA